MCDTLVATPAATADRVMILAKNSDRELNEAQNITFQPAMKHKTGSMTRGTYIDIPQVSNTYAVLLSRPFWMFGAEMGVNEKGVAIGNEAVFTRLQTKTKKLTGMDILRFALERAASAGEAIEVITSLIETHGQGGNGGYQKKLYYDNSFIIADPEKAVILETAGINWVTRTIQSFASISNELTIENDFDSCSKDLELFIKKNKYQKKTEPVNFRKAFTNRLYSHFARSQIRQQCSYSFLREAAGGITPQHMFNFLRDHYLHEHENFPGKKSMQRLCMHAAPGISSQTTGSMVAVLRKGLPPLIWLTGTSSPCLNMYKPHLLTANSINTKISDHTLDLYSPATGIADDQSLWWQGETIHRIAIMNYDEISTLWREIFETVEQANDQIYREYLKLKPEDDTGYLASLCYEKAEEMVNETRKGALFLKQAKASFKNTQNPTSASFRRFYRRQNRKAGLTL